MIYSTDQKGGETMAKITKIEKRQRNNRVKKMRVAAYARVSTESEEQLLSLEVQKEHYENYIKANPYWEYAGLYFDEGISGTKIEKRESLLKLLDDCEKGKIDRVITKSISRFARNTVDCLEMVRKLTGLGVAIYFEKENIDTEHMSSELMLSILSSIAESESRSISENSKWSLKRRFENGTYVISYPPYGYENVDGKMVVVPSEAEIVKEIFRMAISGLGSYLIANELNKRGIATKKNSKWHSSTVQAILKNEKYTGDVIFQKTYTDKNFNRHQNRGEKVRYMMKNHHEPIISHEDFELVKTVVDQRRKEKNIDGSDNKYQKRYALSGKVYCGECGSKVKRCMRYAQSGDYAAWTCVRHIEDKKSCNMKYIREEHIKAAYVQMMNKLIAGKNTMLKPFVDTLRGGNNKDRLRHILELDKKIEKLNEQAQVLTKLLSSGYIELDVFYAENNNISLELDELEKEKASLSSIVSGDLNHLNEAQKLLRFINKSDCIKDFIDDTFSEFVEKITIEERLKFTFHLKCGLNLTEKVIVK